MSVQTCDLIDYIQTTIDNIVCSDPLASVVIADDFNQLPDDYDNELSDDDDNELSDDDDNDLLASGLISVVQEATHAGHKLDRIYS